MMKMMKRVEEVWFEKGNLVYEWCKNMVLLLLKDEYVKVVMVLLVMEGLGLMIQLLNVHMDMNPLFFVVWFSIV